MLPSYDTTPTIDNGKNASRKDGGTEGRECELRSVSRYSPRLPQTPLLVGGTPLPDSFVHLRSGQCHVPRAFSMSPWLRVARAPGPASSDMLLDLAAVSLVRPTHGRFRLLRRTTWLWEGARGRPGSVMRYALRATEPSHACVRCRGAQVKVIAVSEQ